MADPLSQDILDKLPDDFVVEVAHLDDDAQQQVFDEARAAAENGELQDFDADDAISRAEEVADRKEAVEDLKDEQAERVADGDFEGARDTAREIQWEAREIADDGGDSDAQMLDAQRDDAKLDDAAHEQETATDQVEWGDRLAEGGDLDGAATQYDLAGGHAEAAADSAGVADVGGVTADHSYDATDSTVDTTTSE